MLSHFLLVTLFISISNVIPFPNFPSTNSLSHSPFPLTISIRVLTLPPTYPLQPHCPNTPLCWGIEPSQAQGLLLPLVPFKDPLLHMRLEPWVPPCVLFGWWFSPWELWGFWLVDIVVLPMGLQTPSALSVLLLTPSLGSLCSVLWLAASICICIGQDLAEPLRRQLYQDPVSKQFLASAIVLGLVSAYGMDLQVGQSLDGLSFSRWESKIS